MRKFILLAFTCVASAFPVAAQDLTGRLDSVPYSLNLANPALKAEASGKQLILVAPKGSDLFTPVEGKPANTAPRVTFEPEGDFIFSAKVNGGFGADYDGGALLIYGDDGYWAKLLFERINEKESVVTSSFASPVSDNSYHVRLPETAPAIWLKIVRAGRSVLFYMSRDGRNWQILRDFAVDPSRRLAVAFESQSPLGERYTGQFSDIRFEARRFKDYWQGE